MANPTEFLSRTGFRQVKATTNANLSGVITSVGNVTSVGTLTTALIPEVTNLYFTDERAQDAVGTILVDSAEIDFTYADATPSITAVLLATTVVADSYGTASNVGSFTVDSKGRLTAASNTAIAITASQVTDFNEAAEDAVGGILTDTATIDFTYNDGANTITADLKNTTVAAASYGSASAVGTFTVDAQGRLTTAATTSINITTSQISNFVTATTALIEADFTTTFMLMGA